MDAWDVLSSFGEAALHLSDDDPAVALERLSLLAHRLRGTAALYNYPQVAKLAEVIETFLERAPNFPPEQLPDVQVFLEQAHACIGSSLERIGATGEEGDLGLEFATLGGAALFRDLLRVNAEHLVLEESVEAKVIQRQASVTARLRHFYRDNADDWSFFAPEASDLLEKLAAVLDQVRQSEGETDENAKKAAVDNSIQLLFRATHTLKGAAYMVGLDVMGDLAHALEDLMVQVREGERSFDSGIMEALGSGQQVLGLMLDTARGQDTLLESELAALERRLAQLLGTEVTELEKTPKTLSHTLRHFYHTQADIWAYFGPEAEMHVGASRDLLASAPEGETLSDEDLGELYRALHTLKGAAYTVELAPFGDLSGQLEKLITEVREAELPFGEVREVLGQGVTVLAEMLQVAATEADANATDEDLERTWTTLQNDLMTLLGTPIVTQAADALATGPGTKPSVKVSRVQSVQTVRVRLDKLETLMRLAGEAVTLRSRLAGQVEHLGEVGGLLKNSRARLLRTVSEFETQYLNPNLAAQTQRAEQPEGDEREGLSASLDEMFNELEFDTYNDLNILARSVAEMADDLGEVEAQLGTVTRGFKADTETLQSLSRDLRSEVSRARMVPVGQLFGRLRRLLKTSKERAYKLELAGETTEIDTAILEGLLDPLLHLVRNAATHGVEPRETRLKLGKSETGRVSLRARHQGNHLYLEVEDDGAGIDLEALKRKAVEKGLRRQDEVDALGDDAGQLIFLPGLSTVSEVSTGAGRGVGMDAVLEGVERLQGDITFSSTPDVGTRFVLKLPLTLIVSEALMVRVAGETLAFPANTVETLRYLAKEEIVQEGEGAFAEVNGERLSYLALQPLLGFVREADEPASHALEQAVAILRTGDAKIAVGVDELLELEEVVVRGVGDLLAPLSYLSGTTVSATGHVILMLDPAGLPQLSGEASTPTVSLRQTVRPSQKHLLLVDDSVSVRRVLDKMLARSGYRVTSAVDGQEAVDFILQGDSFDVVLTDLEMPRLNGYELLEELRRRPETLTLPTVIMTTRAGEKHRKLAFELGANHYLTKPIDEAKLLRTLEETLAAPDAGQEEAAR